MPTSKLAKTTNLVVRKEGPLCERPFFMTGLNAKALALHGRGFFFRHVFVLRNFFGPRFGLDVRLLRRNIRPLLCRFIFHGLAHELCVTALRRRLPPNRLERAGQDRRDRYPPQLVHYSFGVSGRRASSLAGRPGCSEQMLPTLGPRSHQQ